MSIVNLFENKDYNVNFNRVLSDNVTSKVVSRPWLSLGVAETSTQGPVLFSQFLISPDFAAFGTAGQFITFSETGFYRITASFTFMCTSANAPEREVFVEFRTASTVLIKSSDQVIAADSGNVYGNASFNRIIEITTLTPNTFFFNWGSLSDAGSTVVLRGESHITLERVA